MDNYIKKFIKVQKYSDPFIVFENAKRILGDDVKINISYLPQKKYMVEFNDDGKYIHFGQMGFEDYTKHKDKRRRTLFKNRNHKWKYYAINTPAYLSYHLLW